MRIAEHDDSPRGDEPAETPAPPPLRGSGSNAERAAFDRVLVEHIPSALRFATQLCGNADWAEDLVQEAVVRAAQRWQSFESRSRFSTWLFTILINVFRDLLTRRTLPTGGTDPDELPGSASEPSRVLESKEFGERVAATVSRLPPRQREVLVLVAYERESPAEVAKMLGMTEQNVRTTLHHAREKVRAMLAPHARELHRDVRP